MWGACDSESMLGCGWRSNPVVAGPWLWLPALLAALLAMHRGRLTIGISWGKHESRLQLQVDSIAVAKEVESPPAEEPDVVCHFLGLDDPVADEENFKCKSAAAAVEEASSEGEEDWDEGWSFTVPNWANSLLQPLIPEEEGEQEQEQEQEELNRIRSSRNRGDANWPSRWDAVFKMHTEVDFWKRRARDEVVRIWGDSKRKLVHVVVLGNKLLVASDEAGEEQQEEDVTVVRLWDSRAKAPALAATSASPSFYVRKGRCFDLRMLRDAS